MLNKLRLWYYFYFAPDLPKQSAIRTDPVINRYSLTPYYPRYVIMAIMYKDGWTIQEIAEKFNVPRERVRQCLWKAARRR